MSKVPARVRKCTNHHNACACREWRFEQMEVALKIISTWAAWDDFSHDTREEAMQHIENMAKEALNG